MEKITEFMAFRFSRTALLYASTIVVSVALLLGMFASGMDTGYIASCMLGIVFALCALKRPYVALILFIMLVVFFSRAFVHLTIGGIYVTEFVLLFVLLSFWLKLNLSGHLLIPRYPLLPLFVVLYVISYYSLCRGLAAYPDTQFVFRHAALFYYSLLYFIIPLLFDSMRKIRILLYCYLAASILVAAISVCGGSVLGIHFSEFAYFHVSLALIFVFVHMVVNKRYSVMNLSIVTLFIYVVVQGMARSVWVGLLTSFAFLIIMSWRMKVMRVLLDRGMALVLILLLCGAGITFIVKPQYVYNVKNEALSIVNFSHSQTTSDLNAQWRLLVWKDIIAETMQKPLLGWGFGKKFIPPTIQQLGWGGSWSDPAKRFQDPHNSFLSVFYRTGLFGLMIFVGILIVFIVRTCGVIVRQSDTEVSTYLLALLMCMLFIIGTANFMVLLEGPFLGIFLWIVMGLIVAIERASLPPVCSQKIEGGEV